MSVIASVLFTVLYSYTTLLAPLSGEQVFGWRMLLTFPCVSLFMLVSGDWQLARDVAQRIRRTPALLLGLLVLSGLIAVQLWLFLWAPLHGRGLHVSLGYFLLPLTMILTGRLLYGDRLSRLQKTAAACAAMGVAHAFYQVGSLSWETLLVALGYPLYFALRRRLRTDHLGGLWFDMALMLPAALWFVQAGEPIGLTFAEKPALYGLIPVLGMLSASALICYILASRALAFSLFGLLGYVEPVLLVAAALALGETIAPEEWLTFLPIWLAVLLLVLEGVRHLASRRTP
nr:EamA family transporter RarD [Pseudomonas sp. RIT-PI-AD]